MPEEGDEKIPRTPPPDVLSAGELRRLFHLFVSLGVRKVRLTGGEPTTRGDFARIVEDLGQLSNSLAKPLTMGITTNGVRLSRFLPQLREAGLRNVNLSLDTLVSAKFPLLTRRPAKWHRRVLDLVHELAADKENFTLKVNCVLLRGVNEDEIGAFVDLTEKLPIEVRFLEFMPFDQNGWSAGRLVPQATILQEVQHHLQQRGFPQAQRLPPDSLNDVARLWRVPGWKGRIGVIASMTDAFCGGCNRVRVTAVGELRNCLFGEEGWSIRDAMRQATDDASLVDLIQAGVRAKHVKLGGKRDMHELRERGAFALPMMSLGG